jgi:transcriptional regulator NrdR family protein
MAVGDLRHCSCGGKTHVVSSEDARCGDAPSIRRRRECRKCGVRVTTYEIVATPGSIVAELSRVADRVVSLVDHARSARAHLGSFIELCDDKGAEK